MASLVEILKAESWHRDAACAEYSDPERRNWWFPEQGDSGTGRAKAICAACLVKAECLSWALAQQVPPPGVWGALSEVERRQRRAGAPGAVKVTTRR